VEIWEADDPAYSQPIAAPLGEVRRAARRRPDRHPMAGPRWLH